MKKHVFYLILMLFIFFSAPVHAYIDPGTGSLLASTIIGIGITLLFSLRGLLYKAINRISSGNKLQSYDFTGKIVFFNEGKNYWKVFKPVLQEFERHNHHFVYITADSDDPGIAELNPEICEVVVLKNIQHSIVVLNRIKANMVVMTTPQLDILHLKRSKHVKHYCHILHSPVDIHTYEKFAFDYFDSVLCSSTFQIENLRQLEQSRNSSPKELFETGCTYYDGSAAEKFEGDSVLVAPTWGDKSFFLHNGDKLIESILEGGHKVIYRPHPQSWISDKELVNGISEKYASNPNFVIDNNPDNISSLRNSKVMICDFSGVIYDYAFLQCKPVIAVDRQWKDGGYESSDILNQSSAVDLLEKVGMLIDEHLLPQINDILHEVSSRKVEKNTIDEHLFNFCCAGPVATEQIFSINRGLK